MSNDETTDNMNKEVAHSEDEKKTHTSRSKTRTSRSKSQTASRSPQKNKKESKSKSKKLGKSKNGRKMSTSSRSSSSPSPSRSRSPRPSKSKKNHRSRKHKLPRSHSRSRSRSDSHSRSRSRSRRPRRYGNYRSNRNFNEKPRNNKYSRETRDIPPANRVLGCFGLSNRTTEDILHREFEQFGKIEKVILITDRRTGQSKGYGFIYFANIDDSTKAKEAMSGIDLDGRVIRVDYSLTKRAHSPTPGNYMGPRDRANNNDRNDRNGKNKPDRNGRRRNRSASRSMD